MAQGRKTKIVIVLSHEDRKTLQGLQRKTTIAWGIIKRVKIIMSLADGHSILETGRNVGMARRGIYKWVARYQKEGIAGLFDKAGRGGAGPRRRTKSEVSA